jgi:hypothetical protein
MFKILALINKLSCRVSANSKWITIEKKMANGNHWLPLLCDHKGGALIRQPKNIISLIFFPSVKETGSIRNWLDDFANSSVRYARFLQLQGHHHE